MISLEDFLSLNAGVSYVPVRGITLGIGMFQNTEQYRRMRYSLNHRYSCVPCTNYKGSYD